MQTSSKTHDSLTASQQERLMRTGYTLTAQERATIDERHRLWAAATAFLCGAAFMSLVLYPVVFK